MIQAIDTTQGRLRDEFAAAPHPVEGQAADPSQGETASAEGPEQRRRENSESGNPHPTARETTAGDPAGEAGNPQSEISNPQSDVPLLTAEERRQILVRLARVNPLDCFDASGAFDLDRARRVLPPGSIRCLTVHETTHPNAGSEPITERRIDVGLFNPVSALRLDEHMERRRERDASGSSSGSHSPRRPIPKYSFNRLREKTMALDDTLQEIAQLKKTLAEMDEQELQLIQELEEMDRQLPKAVRSSNELQILENLDGKSTERIPDASREAGFATPLSGNSQTPNPACSPSPQGETGFQSVHDDSQTPADHPPVTPKRRPPENREPIEIRLRKMEIEHRRNTSGPLGFALWLRAKQAEWAEIDSQSRTKTLQSTQHLQIVGQIPARPSTRPPP